MKILEDQRNAVNCENRWGVCDHSKLTFSEARETALAEHQRNLSTFKDGQKTRKPATIQSYVGDCKCFRMVSTSATTALA